MKNKQIKHLAKKKILGGVVILLCCLPPEFILNYLVNYIKGQINLTAGFPTLQLLIWSVITIFAFFLQAPLLLGITEAFIMLSNNEKVTIKVFYIITQDYGFSVMRFCYSSYLLHLSI